MPQLPIDALRAQVRGAFESAHAPRPFIAFGCARGADIGTLAAPDVLALPLICTGQLPPSFVEYALRAGAVGVLVASCRDGGCGFRLGARWAAERLSGEREPHLRASVPRDRVLRIEADAGEEASLHAGLAMFRQRLPGPGVPVGSNGSTSGG